MQHEGIPNRGNLSTSSFCNIHGSLWYEGGRVDRPSLQMVKHLSSLPRRPKCVEQLVRPATNPQLMDQFLKLS